ncbi:hypothetical protein [Streptomyces sp. NPDC003006]
MDGVNGGRKRLKGSLSRTKQFTRPLPQELTMADLAFVATTIAVFALVALVAKGVTKL